jgi:hypothetical protein
LNFSAASLSCRRAIYRPLWKRKVKAEVNLGQHDKIVRPIAAATTEVSSNVLFVWLDVATLASALRPSSREPQPRNWPQGDYFSWAL